MVTARLKDADAARIDGRGRLLFLMNSLAVGGTERKMVALANALTRRGGGVHVAYLNGPDTLRGGFDAAVPVAHLGRRGRCSPTALARLVRYAAGNDIQRIVAVNLHPLVYALPAAALLPRRPDVIALVNISIHRSPRERRFMRLYAPLLRRASRVVFGSGAQRTAWVRDYGLEPGRCECILNGVDLGRFGAGLRQDPRARLGIRAGEFVVGSVGGLRPEKAYGDLLHAAGALWRGGVPVRVLLVGDGPCREELQRCAGREGIAGRCVFHGHADDVRPLLDAMDVFVLPSVSETFSNAALEAMASATAVVLSDVGGAREMIVPGESGVIYRPGDVAALAGELRRLYRHEETRQALARAARARVVRRFSFQRMLEDYERRVFQRAVSAEDAARPRRLAAVRRVGG